MSYEIERKFLVEGDGWRAQAGAGERLRQGYLAGGARGSVRVRAGAGRASLNVKGATVGAVRREFDYPIPLTDAEVLLAELCERPLIEKTRYRVVHAGHVWEIDVFDGANAGLTVAEIELDTVDQAFERPAWLGDEVTDDPRYYNVSLARQPYRDWSADA